MHPKKYSKSDRFIFELDKTFESIIIHAAIIFKVKPFYINNINIKFNVKKLRYQKYNCAA